MILSEVEVREKVVAPWLNSIGIDIHSIRLEKKFKIRLGHGIYEVNSCLEKKTLAGRADYLVKSNENVNLFIIEVKATDIVLSCDDRDQGISYARLIENGNIPPFLILTNGVDTKLYNTISKEEILSINEFNSHPDVKSNFIVSCDISAQFEALNYLISFSAENLLAFCRYQVEYRMKILKSEDIKSGKKYIPSLYVERVLEKNEIANLLFHSKGNRNVALITGPPQFGKTSFVCNLIEDFIKSEIPCLFYPAIGLKTGLLQAIQDDFFWCFNNNSPIHLMIRRLDSILKSVDKNLILVIDGLNEIDQERAHAIGIECERLDLQHIKVIISATANSLSKILFIADNPTFFAENTNLTLADARLLKYKKLSNLTDKNIIQIESFSHDEYEKAIKTYSTLFKVEVKNKNFLLKNPFYLRGAMELYSNSELPAELDAAEIISCNLLRKASRAGMDHLLFISLLNKINELIFITDAPYTQLHKLNIEAKLLQKLIDAAIIVETHDNLDTYGIDYYYSRERDYSIAYYLRNWSRKLSIQNAEELIVELNHALQTSVGREALRWFLSSRTHINQLKNCYEILRDENNNDYNEIFLNAIFNQNFTDEADKIWLEKIFTQLYGKTDVFSMEPGEVENLSLIIYKLIISTNIVFHSITSNQLFLFKKLLLLETLVEDSDIGESYSKQLVEETSYEQIYSHILLFDEDINIVESTAYLLSDCPSDFFLETLNSLIVCNRPYILNRKQCFIKALKNVDDISSMADMYCSFEYSESLADNVYDLECYINRYRNIFDIFTDEITPYIKGEIEYLKNKIIELYPGNVELDDNLRKRIFSLLNIQQDSPLELVRDNPVVKDPNQLYIPFHGEFIACNSKIITDANRGVN